MTNNKTTASMIMSFTWECPHCKHFNSENFDSTEQLHLDAVTGSWGIDTIECEDEMYEKKCIMCGKVYYIDGVEW